MQEIWFKNAIIYCVDVETFLDGNGDGIGDFQGLTHRLDYIVGLGATCIWLLPFHPSPNRDNGYDITDYYAVDPRYGTLGDFVEFIRLAQDRGLRVIIDLVVNHTSIDHPWFQAARRDPASPYRDYYIWSRDKPPDAHKGVVFPGYQESTWSWDDTAGAYYFHRFYDHEPDLNTANPAVAEEIERIMGFWIQLGVSGFRLDAAPFVIEDQPGNRERRFEQLKEIRAFLSWRKGDAVLLAEANVTAEEVGDYFGTGERINMMFNFIANQRLFLALAREDAAPLAQALGSLPPIPERAQWASFLRNHDELDLGRLTESERHEVFTAFAPEPNMRIYDRGIRRRLAPMLGNDRERLEMAYSLLFALPGAPVLWYGEEIGMGEDLSLDQRNPVRTPMQWSGEPNGGFSTAPSDRLPRPVIEEGEFGARFVNVITQQKDRGSLLNWMEALARARRECPEIGWGTWTLLPTGDTAILALRHQWRGGSVVTLHNLSRRAREIDAAPLVGEAAELTDIFCDTDYDDPVRSGDRIRINGHGYRWMRANGARR